MRWFFLTPIVIATELFAAYRSADDGQRPIARVPGVVRIEGTPETGGGDFGIEVAFSNLRFQRPLFIGHPGDGTDRLFVLEQDGVVRVFENKPDVAGAEIVLDLRGKVSRRHNEEGLLGMAFHPDFKTNRFVYLHYSADSPRRGTIARFTMDADGGKIDPNSEKIILEQAQPYGNHNGGMIAFGPDGYLYVSFGDGGSSGDPHGNGQSMRTWLGKILRVDVNKGAPYAVPADNPFVKMKDARPEIWAFGLRNVWRFSFDRVTGLCWAGDVGQNRFEEIDIIKKGGNYGWSAREGRQAFRPEAGKGPYEEPIIDLPRGEARSITGGYVYRGNKLPGLYGAYLYADYETGNVWALRWDGTKARENKLLCRGRNIAGFGEDRDGEVYLCSFDGRIYRFVARGKSQNSPFPTRLSATGLFTDVEKLVPHPSLIPYDVNVPLWSDGAEKRRWIMLPGMEKIRVNAGGGWEFPRGTIFVKHFEMKPRRLETRLLINGLGGWVGYTYVWDEHQKEAFLIDGRVERTSDPVWAFPSRSDCMSCHTEAGGRILGFTPAQLNRQYAYASGSANQIEALAKAGVFDASLPKDLPAFPAWGDAAADRDRAVRAYLDVNCAMCHQPSGPGNATIDLRWSTPLEKTHLINEEPGAGDLGVKDARIVVPGSPERSLLLLRMKRTDEHGMPNMPHHRVDEEAIHRIEAWIRAMK